MLELRRDIGIDERSAPPLEPMLKRYHELRSWDSPGMPKAETLEWLGLPRLDAVGSS